MPNEIEPLHNLDPLDADTDNDGIPDGEELFAAKGHVQKMLQIPMTMGPLMPSIPTLTTTPFWILPIIVEQ